MRKKAPRPTARGARAGVTLLELLASLTVLVLLCSLAVVNFAAFRRGSRLTDGALRFETVLRLARATAANRGRRLKLTFQPQTALLEVLWEPQPLAEPGAFVPCDAVWCARTPNALVRATACRLTGPSAYRKWSVFTGGGEDDEDESLADLTFYPDGSSDSALIELADTEAEDGRRALIEVSGASGRITAQVLGERQLQEYYEQMEASGD